MILRNKYNSFVNLKIKKLEKNKKYYAIKSNVCKKNERTTCCSKLLQNYFPTYSADAISFFEKQNFSFLGSTSMDEFACGTKSKNTFYKKSVNPLGYAHTGGSSGGSASLIRATGKKYLVLSICSTTGGSIGVPACMNAVFGFVPSKNTISRHGLIDYSNSLDRIGFHFLNFDCFSELKKYFAGLKKNIIPSISFFYYPGLLQKIKDLFHSLLVLLGVKGKYIDLSNELTRFNQIYPIIAFSELYSNLNRYDSSKFGLSFSKNQRKNLTNKIKERLYMGVHFISSGAYMEAISELERIRQSILHKLKEQTFLFMPCFSDEIVREDKIADIDEKYFSFANLIPGPTTYIPFNKLNINSTLQITSITEGTEINLLDFVASFKDILYGQI